jgi:TRAP-type mannitol/chloroaromatic compound transport system permease large subunit
VKGLVPKVPLSEIFRGILPFWVAMVVCVGLLILFPELATFLPDAMIN